MTMSIPFTDLEQSPLDNRSISNTEFGAMFSYLLDHFAY